MIRVGNGKPRIWFTPITYEFPHYECPPYFSYSTYWWLSLHQYMNIKEYETFNLRHVNMTYDNVWQLTKTCWRPESEMTPQERVQQLFNPDTIRTVQRVLDLNPSKTLLWQYDAPDANFEWTRHITCFADSTTVRWSWADAAIKYPLCKLACYVLNSLRINKLIDRLFYEK